MFNMYLIGGVVIATVLAGSAGYFWWSQNRMAAMSEEIASVREANVSLEAANRDLQASYERIRVETEALNRRMADLRTLASQTMRQLTQRDFSRGEARLLEQQINTETNDLLRRMEELSRAP